MLGKLSECSIYPKFLLITFCHKFSSDEVFVTPEAHRRLKIDKVPATDKKIDNQIFVFNQNMSVEKSEIKTLI